MQQAIRWMASFNRGVARFLELVAGTLLAVTTLVVVAQVFFRYVLGQSLYWSEELSRYLLIWTVMCGVALAWRAGGHVNLDIFQGWLSPELRKVARTISQIATIIMLLLVVRFSWTLAMRNMNQISPALQVPYGLVQLAIPVGSLITALFVIEDLLVGLRTPAAVSVEPLGPAEEEQAC